MMADRQQLLEDICLRALEIDLSGRAAFLRESCIDEQLRIEAESLLAASDYADEFFKASPGLPAAGDDAPPQEIAAPEAGQQIGPYRLLERLGEGGMGVVYRASQREPVRREVALKIIRPGMDSGLVAARFAAERQALSLMEHPNIARVVDAGTTDSDRAYFVMELVRGQPITAWCDRERLTVRQRIELMAPVCQAIQHAHQKGVIHRDIKPSNILVGSGENGPVPKVIDFGIAKATENPLHDGATFTRAFDVVGTFEYMSPEQAEPGGRNVDVRSDVYALGAVLYELLAGVPPLAGLSLRENGFAAIIERVQHETPQPPSQRVRDPRLAIGAIAENRGCDAVQLRAQIAGECDWIVLKALDKDPARRYQSADGMARDLRRYLDGEPLEAGPQSAAYRLRKFAAKFKYWVAAAAAVIVLLLAASIAMAFALRQQSRANSNAMALRDVVRRIIIERPAQLAEVPNRTALRSQLMHDAEGALDALGQDAGNDDSLKQELARAYLSIGLEKGPYSSVGSELDPEGAAKYVKKSVDLYNALARKKPNDPIVRRGQVEALSTWLHLQYRLFNSDEGKKAASELEAEIGNMPSPLQDKIQARWYLSIGYMELGSILWNTGTEADVMANQRKALSAFQDSVPTEWIKDSDRLDHLSHLERELTISAWMSGGIAPEVETTARMAVQAVAGCGANNCRMRHAQSEGTLGEIEWASGRHSQGLATTRKSLAEFDTLCAEDPQNAVFANAGAQVRAYLALMLTGGSNSSEAVALAGKNLRLAKGADAKLSKGHERSMVNRITLGAALAGARRFDDAARELNDTLQQNRREWIANYDLQWSALHLLARILEAQGKYEEEVNTAREAMKFTVRPSPREAHLRTLNAIAARDLAFAVAHWKNASPDARAEALEELDAADGLDERYAVLVGALIESPPKASEVASIRSMLSVPKRL
jgi:serine/threonine protein kinase